MGEQSVVTPERVRRIVEVASRIPGDPKAEVTLRARPSPTGSTNTRNDLPTITFAEPRPQHPTEGAEPTPFDLAPVEVLGEGGMGRVLLATQRSLSRLVAVKVLLEGATPGQCDGLVREARMAGGLEHPAIVPVHALGMDAVGRPVLVMKRIEGVSWAAMLAEPRHPSWASHSDDRLEANFEILAHVCRALELAHSRGIVHRDIKPSNVMVGKFGEVYLVDWGLATGMGPVEDGAIVGTPKYMAPEMALGEPVDALTDVYLLGATLHRVLTGTPRHAGDTFAEVVHAALESAPIVYPPAVPHALAALCNEATAQDPSNRPSSVRAFRERLGEFLRRRNALTICEAATKSLAELERQLATARPGALTRDPAVLYGLASEARFGLRQSLAIDPDSEQAQRTMRRSTIALVELELLMGHVELAESLLGEVVPREPALGERISDAKAAATARDQETEHLRDMVRDRDPAFTRRARITFSALFVCLVLVCVMPKLVAVAIGQTKDGWAILVSVLLCLGATLVTALLSRGTFRTASNRALLFSLLGLELLITSDRVVGLVAARPVSLTLQIDLLIIAATTAPLSAVLFPRAWWAVALAVAGSAAIGHVPERAIAIYTVSFLLVVVLSVWAMWARAMRTSRGPVTRR